MIASRVMGIPELIEDQVSGRLVAPGSLPDLADALSELVADADERRRLGRAARTRVASEFELTANADRLRGLYEELLNGATPSPLVTAPEREVAGQSRVT